MAAAVRGYRIPDMVVPKVSVIVPSYNHARYLGRRIESIVGQTFGDLELLILDDASTDDSLLVLLPYVGRPRVRLQVNPTNTGSALRQWQKGIALARGSISGSPSPMTRPNRSFLSGWSECWTRIRTWAWCTVSHAWSILRTAYQLARAATTPREGSAAQT
jgi:cellulose synthase/poly-beta-1,6-N-acetylglucosamine synthase-like glycosyltransferase